jgi:protease-4
MNQEKSMPVRILGGVWRVINGARIIFLNALFLLLMLFLFIGFMAAPDETVHLQGDTTLVLRPAGRVVEEFSTTPFDRAIQQATGQMPAETRLRDLIRAIDRASTDSRISQMVIETDYLWSIGLSSLRDLEVAVEKFKEQGKPVVAMGDGMGQHQYYLAALADEVWLHPNGMIWIDGYSRIRHFYREGLEKLAVEINLFRVGEYKSAMEPYIRDDMSPEAREATQFWLGSLWQQYLEGVSKHRGIPLDRLNRAIDNMADSVEAVGGDFARFALDLGLVDRLINRPDARHELGRRGAPNRDGDGYRGIDSDAYLTLVDAIHYRRSPQVSVVVAEGEIVRGQQGSGQVGSETTVQQLRELGADDTVQAVVLRINSPGGDALASEQIRRQVQALRDNGKTVVVSMGDVAASGGYWIAMSADEVWASPTTITGSIGVFGMIPTFGATLEKIGVRADGVGTTAMAGKLRVDRPLDADVRRLFQSATENVYEQFLDLVAEARGMSVDEVDRVARGRVWSGSQAADHGLVDQTGSLQDAIDAAARIAGLGSDYRAGWYEVEITPFERFFLEMTSGVVARFSVGSAPVQLVPQTFVQSLIEDLAFIAGKDGKLTIAAHCLCGTD